MLPMLLMLTLIMKLRHPCFPLFYRFFTGTNVWSAYVNITKCRIKGDLTPQGARNLRPGERQNAGNACPLRLSVAPRRPPNYLDPHTRKINCLAVNNFAYQMPDDR